MSFGLSVPGLETIIFLLRTVQLTTNPHDSELLRQTNDRSSHDFAYKTKKDHEATAFSLFGFDGFFDQKCLINLHSEN